MHHSRSSADKLTFEQRLEELEANQEFLLSIILDMCK